MDFEGQEKKHLWINFAQNKQIQDFTDCKLWHHTNQTFTDLHNHFVETMQLQLNPLECSNHFQKRKKKRKKSATSILSRPFLAPCSDLSFLK
jgi:hypothetical protein